MASIEESDREIYGLDGIDSDQELSEDDIKGEEEEEIDGKFREQNKP
jgi:hypothetical protein